MHSVNYKDYLFRWLAISNDRRVKNISLCVKSM